MDQAQSKADANDLLEVHDANSLAEENKWTGVKVQPINYASIAKVCETDSDTIEMIVREIVSQIKHMLKHGASIRLAFKIGRLICKSGIVSWRGYRDQERIGVAGRGGMGLLS